MNYIETALATEKNLSVTEFIEETKFAIPIKEIKKFHNISPNIENIYITPELLNYFGYSGNMSNQKEVFLGTLKNNFEEGTDYQILNNKDYEIYYTKNPNELWPHPDNYIGKVGKGKTKHLILNINCLKEFLMILTTSQSRKIKKMFIKLEELFLTYWKYQTLFYKKKFEDELAKIQSLEFIKRQSRLSEIQALEDQLAAKSRVGCIYFIRDGEYVKIGWTFYLRRRFADIQLCNPRPLTLENYYFTVYPAAEEERLHKEYTCAHVRGEWFRL